MSPSKTIMFERTGVGNLPSFPAERKGVTLQELEDEYLLLKRLAQKDQRALCQRVDSDKTLRMFRFLFGR
jgi:hypothetical protein